MNLTKYINTFGNSLHQRYGEHVHKIAIDAGFTCPNRDGSRGDGIKDRAGCTFCNNASFSPNGRRPAPIIRQIENGRRVINKRFRANKFIAYFQAYTNTYAKIERLDELYQQALHVPGVIGLAVGTRPDCVSNELLDLLRDYQQRGYEIWLELGLQSAFDKTLERINRGHGFAEYQSAVRRARNRGIQVCTHLIIGLPGETYEHYAVTLDKVLNLGVDGLKLHPLHVVKGTQLANEWRRGEYQPLELEEYVHTAADLIEATPPNVVFHRLTSTASENILLAPMWCAHKWLPLNLIAEELESRHNRRRRQSIPKFNTAYPY